MIQFSYSFLDAFFNVCPEQSRHLFVLRDVKKSYSVAAGVDWHRVLEDRIKHKAPLPVEALVAEPFVAALEARGPVEAEVSLAVDNWLRPTGFWAKGSTQTTAWLRGKFDVVMRGATAAFVGDWKTGKKRESPDQLEIGALLLMETHPEIETVTGVNIWLKAGGLGTPYTFVASEKGQRWARWITKMRHVEALDPAVEWPKHETPLCGWCPVRACEFNREEARLAREAGR